MTGKETYKDEEIIRIFKEYMQKKGKFPSKSQIEADKSLPSYTTVKRRFGSLLKFKQILGVDISQDLKRKDTAIRYTNDDIKKRVQKFIEQTGRFPLYEDFENTSYLPSHHTIMRRFEGIEGVKKFLGVKIKPTKTSEIIRSTSTILREYYEELLETASSETTRTYINILLDFREFLLSKGKDIETLTDEDIIHYIKILREKGSFKPRSRNIRKNSINTIYGKMRVISTFLKWILDISEETESEPHIKRSMIKRIRRRIKRGKSLIGVRQQTKRRALTPEEVLIVREKVLEPFLRNLFDIGLNLCLRISEYCRITLSDIHFDEDYILIKGKGGKERLLALTREMQRLLQRQIEFRKLNGVVDHEYLFFLRGWKRPLTRSRLQRYYKEMSKISEVKFGSHNLRYTHSVMLLKKGVPRYIVKSRLGHLSDGTDLYLRDKIEEEKRILETKVGML